MAGWGDPRDSATENKPPYQGKGEKVWEEHTGWLVTDNAWKTPLRAKLSRDDIVKTKSGLWLVIRVSCLSLKAT